MSEALYSDRLALDHPLAQPAAEDEDIPGTLVTVTLQVQRQHQSVSSCEALW